MSVCYRPFIVSMYWPVIRPPQFLPGFGAYPSSNSSSTLWIFSTPPVVSVTDAKNDQRTELEGRIDHSMFHLPLVLSPFGYMI